MLNNWNIHTLKCTLLTSWKLRYWGYNWSYKITVIDWVLYYIATLVGVCLAAKLTNCNWMAKYYYRKDLLTSTNPLWPLLPSSIYASHMGLVYTYLDSFFKWCFFHRYGIWSACKQSWYEILRKVRRGSVWLNLNCNWIAKYYFRRIYWSALTFCDLFCLPQFIYLSISVGVWFV